MATLLDTLVTKISFMIEGTPLETLVRILDNDTVATQELGTASVETAEKMKGAGAAASTLGGESEKAAVKMKEAGHEAKEAGVAAEFFGEQVKHLKSILKDFFGLFLGLEVISESVESFNDMSQAMAQIQAGLKSTGDAAGFTSDQLEDMAQKLQETSTYDKADILRNVTAQLISFKDISGDTFNRAQQDIVDYGARFNKTGDELQQVSVQLGRALSDPAEALGALTRYGISFSEAQKKSIEAMVKSGDTAEAQSIILGQLEEKYKGSAQAAAVAGSGPLLQFISNLKSLAEVIGGLIATVLNPLLIIFNNLAIWMQNNATFAKIFAASFVVLASAVLLVKKAQEAWNIVIAISDALLSPIIDIFVAITLAALALGLVIQDLWVYFHGGDSVIGRLINRFEDFIGKHKELKAVMGVVAALFKLYWGVIKLEFEVAVKAIEAGVNLIINLFNEAANIVGKFAGGVESAFSKVEGLLSKDSSQNGDGTANAGSGFVGLLNNLTGKINGVTAVIGGNAPQSSSITNNSHAPVTNVNLTVHANSSEGHHIGKVVKEALTNHFKNTARAYDSGVAS